MKGDIKKYCQSEFSQKTVPDLMLQHLLKHFNFIMHVYLKLLNTIDVNFERD